MPKKATATKKKQPSRTAAPRRAKASRAASHKAADRQSRPAAGAPRRARRRPAAPELDLDTFRELLEQERDRLLHELEEIESRTARRSKLDAAIEAEDYDENLGDAATDTLERGTDMALERNVHAMLDQVEASLGKIETGTYGICDSCGLPIGERRLRALPYATLCLACQDLMERS